MSLEDELRDIDEDAGPNVVRWLIRFGRAVYKFWRQGWRSP